MTAKTHLTAAVLIPAREVWEPIQAIRRAHDRHARRWMPHITLVYPFRPREEFDSLLQPLRTTLQGLGPFAVKLEHFRWFRHGRSSWTVWLDPAPREPLIELERRLEEVVPDCDDARRHQAGFTPHLSVAQFRGGERALAELVSSLQAGWSPLLFKAAEVSLIARDGAPADVFRVEAVVEMGGGPS